MERFNFVDLNEIELLAIELLDHLTVCINVKIGFGIK